MLHWILRQWWSEPSRALLVTAVFGGVIALTILFAGVKAGILGDAYDYPASLPADFVALEKDSERFAWSMSNLPQLSRERAETAIPGVVANPIVMVPFILRKEGFQSPAMLVGFDALGGPQYLAEGRAPSVEREIVLDERLAQLHGMKLGETVDVFDAKLKVVGLSQGTSSPFSPYAFVTYDRLIDVLLESDLSFGTEEKSLVTALLIKLPAGTNLADARQKLVAAMPEADLFTPLELARADRAFVNRLLGTILSLVLGIAWLIALLTMAMLRYADVHTNLRQYGIQKALGAPPRSLAFVLATGGVIIAVSALPIGIIVAKVLADMIAAWNPLYTARLWEADVLLQAVAVAILASVGGSLIPLRRLTKIDPVIVFQR